MSLYNDKERKKDKKKKKKKKKQKSNLKMKDAKEDRNARGVITLYKSLEAYNV